MFGSWNFGWNGTRHQPTGCASRCCRPGLLFFSLSIPSPMMASMACVCSLWARYDARASMWARCPACAGLAAHLPRQTGKGKHQRCCKTKGHVLSSHELFFFCPQGWGFFLPVYMHRHSRTVKKMLIAEIGVEQNPIRWCYSATCTGDESSDGCGTRRLCFFWSCSTVFLAVGTLQVYNDRAPRHYPVLSALFPSLFRVLLHRIQFLLRQILKTIHGLL